MVMFPTLFSKFYAENLYVYIHTLHMIISKFNSQFKFDDNDDYDMAMMFYSVYSLMVFTFIIT